jgi:hypothetical protein
MQISHAGDVRHGFIQKVVETRKGIPYGHPAIDFQFLLRLEQLVVDVENFPRANQGDDHPNCERVEELYCVD